MFEKSILRLYFIAGTQDFMHKSSAKSALYKCLEKSIEAGVSCFQYREKGALSLKNKTEIYRTAAFCRKICAKYAIPFLVDDNYELAKSVDADGIHLGQKDDYLNIINKIKNEKKENFFIGLSVNTVEQAVLAQDLDVNYLGAGAIFSTSSKADASSAKGIEFLDDILKAGNKKPLVAIGGINEENCNLFLNAPCDGIAVISAISQAKDPKKTVKKLLMQY